jgi:hypothetical protein
LLAIYRDHSLDLVLADRAVEAGILEVWERLGTGGKRKSLRRAPGRTLLTNGFKKKSEPPARGLESRPVRLEP